MLGFICCLFLVGFINFGLGYWLRDWQCAKEVRRLRADFRKIIGRSSLSEEPIW